MIVLNEIVNSSKLKNVLLCENIPIDNELDENDINWRNNFRETLQRYTGKVKYYRKYNFGRYQGDGLQKCPRDIRKYLADGKYIDIDIVNCHPIILEQLFLHNNIDPPEFLTLYNNDRDNSIKSFRLKDKYGIFKIINNEKCYYKQILIKKCHESIYKLLLPCLKVQYNHIYKIIYECKTDKRNINGSFISHVLQNIENEILMCIYSECIKLNYKVGVLVFDGLMIEKNDTKIDLSLLVLSVKKNTNYLIKLVEKDMVTDWIPVINESTQQTQGVNVNEDDVKKEYNELMKTFKDEPYNLILNKEDGIIVSDVMNDIYKNMCTCRNPKYKTDNTGIYIKCEQCDFRFPSEEIKMALPEKYRHMNLYLNLSITNNNSHNNNSNNVYNGAYNGTVNNGNTNYEFEELEYEIKDVIFKEDTVTNLINNSLDGHKINCIVRLFYHYNKKFVYSCGKWFVFYNKWLLDKDNINMRNNMIDELTQIYGKVKKYYITNKLHESNNIIKNIKSLDRKLNKPGFKQELIKEAELYYNDNYFVSKLNSKKHLVPFENGVFDLIRNKFRKINQDDYIEMTTGYKYDVNIKNDDVYIFMEQILPNKDVRDYVLKKMSECLNGDIPNTNFLMFIGDSGANGKSQLLNLMKATFGDFGEKVEVTLLTRKRNNANETNCEKIKLKNKRFAFLSEPEDGEKINIGLLKELTGSEEIVARGNYEASTTFVMETKLFLACNTLPDIKGEDTALWRRIRVVDFPSKFVDNPKESNEYKIDRTLPTKIREETSWKQTFMNILIEYYYKEITEPDEVKVKTNEYKEGNDINSEFVNKFITKNEENYIVWSELWEQFSYWMFNEYNITANKKVIKTYFESKVFKCKEKQIRQGDDKIRGWKGYELNNDLN